ncbi:M20/M25/M40 family metallo-hydrolase [soil metagenome]
MRMRRTTAAVRLALALSLAAGAASAAQPTFKDADTRAWWAITSHLSSDAMEGRDTGSPGHVRAARWVAERFAAAGLKPAGTAGYLQPIALHEVKVELEGTAISVWRGDRSAKPLRFLHQISVRATEALPATLAAPMSFRGYCSKAEMGADMRGKIAICFGGRRKGVPGGGERVEAAAAAGAVGLISIDDPGFTIEPARWPDAYARSVGFKGAPPPAHADLPVMRASDAAFEILLEGSGRSAADILKLGAASQPLPSFDVPATLHANFRLSTRDYTSDNVLGLLPGTDPALAHEVIVVSAHLDGYGFGELVGGDGLYNGAFDDAAYVATLIRLAEGRAGKGFRRPVLSAAFTGEEKGLLGATAFTRAPTVPKSDLAADINLDQLRPLFPLKILAVHAVDDTTLGDAVRSVAAARGIEVRKDMEPERGLVQRADHWPFLKVGVPATGFVFGYDSRTEAERRSREWYQTRYHRPQDDLGQPFKPEAARDFNAFFYALTQAVADGDKRPVFKAGSALALK